MAAAADHSQRSQGWRQDRAGRITASRFADVMAIGKRGDYLKARGDYMLQLAFERLSGVPRQEVQGAALYWGREVEPFALEAYQLKTGQFVESSEFIEHPDFPFIGCSPDGLIGADGGYESKCPYSEAVHLETFLHGMPAEHVAQVQGCMWVTGRQWWDFVSFDPRQAPGFRLYVQRIPRDDAYIDRLAFELGKFEAELQQQVEDLAARIKERQNLNG